MKKASIFGASNKRDINPDWFTGMVWMKEISERIGANSQDIYHVHFPKGSRTKMHMHNGPQILIAINGSGSLVTYKKIKTGKRLGIKKIQTINLNSGDMVCIQPKTLHTHGSVSDNVEFSHIAINIQPAGNKYKTDWFESDYITWASKMV